MEELFYYAALSSNPAIGPKRFQKIRDRFEKIANFLDLSAPEQMEFLGVKNPENAKLFEAMKARGEWILKTCQNKNITIIPIESPVYPALLKRIPDAPFILYVLGNLNYSVKLVGIVGTRHTTPEAEEINMYFSRELSSYGIGIVSGLARGHDGVAQRTALECGNYTAAVLGSGVDLSYPQENEPLYRQIVQKGAVLSEYPPGTRPLKEHFPLRNRIISGLSDAVLVIQAPEKSGALITAEYASAQGRDIYVIPGSLHEKQYAGSNQWIQRGAKIALTPDDIILDILGKKAERVRNVEPEAEDSFSPEEKAVLKHIEREAQFDELLAKTGIPLARLNHLLTTLEIQGHVEQYPGRYYRRKIS